MWRLSEKCEDRWLLMWSAGTLVALFGATQFWSLACWYGGTVPPKQNGCFLVHVIIFNTLKLHCFMKWSRQKHDLTHLRNWTLAIWNWYLHQKTSVADIVDKKLLSFILLFGSVLRFDFTKFPMQFYRLYLYGESPCKEFGSFLNVLPHGHPSNPHPCQRHKMYM